MLDDLQADAVLAGGFGGVLTGVALIDVGQHHAFPCYLLRLFGQRRNLLAVTALAPAVNPRLYAT